MKGPVFFLKMSHFPSPLFLPVFLVKSSHFLPVFFFTKMCSFEEFSTLMGSKITKIRGFQLKTKFGDLPNPLPPQIGLFRKKMGKSGLLLWLESWIWLQGAGEDVYSAEKCRWGTVQRVSHMQNPEWGPTSAWVEICYISHQC